MIPRFIYRLTDAATVDCQIVGSWVLVAEVVNSAGESGFFLVTPDDQDSDETEAVLKMALS